MGQKDAERTDHGGAGAEICLRQRNRTSCGWAREQFLRFV